MRKGYRSHKKQAKLPELDLGLSNLLGADKDDAGKETPSVAQRKQESGTESGEAPAGPPISEYESLAKGGAWEELAGLCESRLSGEREDPDSLNNTEARLWWIRSQISLSAVPMSMLAAPLESVSKTLLDGSAFQGKQNESGETVRQLAVSLLDEAAVALRAAGEHELALVLMERAYKVAPGERGARLAQWLEQDIGALSSKRRNSKEDQLLAHLQSVRSGIQDRSEAACIEKPSTSKAEMGFEEVRGKISGRRFVPVLLLAVLSVVMFALWRSGRSFEGQRPAGGQELPLVEINGSNAELKLPAAELITQVSHLDAILYDVQRRPQRPIEAARPPEIAKEKVPELKALQSEKESVNTVSPVEPPEVTALLARAGQPPVSPSFDEQSSAQSSIEIHGPPQAPAFKTFANGRIYEVLVVTRIMPRPSIKGEPLAKLAPGSRVMVEGKEGYWLRVRSKQGRVGYVLEQDLNPE